ncbi:uncharacterized protein LOC133521313 [Cydia pomonella]|uniref:uncharacterized protein LOC133521313 n=1 Tax=Cydia pomonella TaxID=82600 RepID=UPI002ADE8185|nr:uncharacterized protein LOC133521313 [Cydia pomonella]
MEKPFHKCRLCLKLGDFCSIFEQDESIKLSDMVMSFANIQIFEGDGHSDRVCTTCIENLSTAYLFKLQCERINAMLQKPPEENLEKPEVFKYNDFLNKEFHMHAKSTEGENVQNVIKEETHVGTSLDVSDETDSDVDSIICVYCNQSHSNLGAHTCRVICSIENNELQRSSSSETLVATDVTPSDTARLITTTPEKPLPLLISCVLCDNKFDKYESYVLHFNKCTLNVKLHHLVCPICHEIHTEKLAYLEHLRVVHFKFDLVMTDTDIDCVDKVPSMFEKTRKPKAVRRQIGWSIEDIYQEIDCKKIEENETPNSSPNKVLNLNATFSNQSTPKKVSFRKFFETSKVKTSNYLPFRKYIQSYRLKKKVNSYSPIKDKLQATSRLKCWHDEMSDTDYNSPSGTSEDSWKLKQNLICTCNKNVFMLSEFIHDRDRIVAMINELGGVVAENTKMEMLATHFIAVLPNDTFTGMMVCALSTGKWLLHINFIYDSFRSKRFLNENMYEWMKHPKILEIDNTSVEVAKAAVYWHLELQALSAKYPFEGKQIVLIMKKKYRQYYQMIFKTLKAKPITYDPRTPGSCCTADYCFVDMKVIQRVKLRFFARHNVPVFPYQYILVYLLSRGHVADEHKYLLQEYQRIQSEDTVDLFNNTC